MHVQPLVPAADASRAPTIEFPGVMLQGESALDTLSASKPKRIPTVFAPFRAGTVFSLAGRQAPPGVTLAFSNMTLLLPNVTYEGIYQSGLMDFFDMGGGARFCFTNRYDLASTKEGAVAYRRACTSASSEISEREKMVRRTQFPGAAALLTTATRGVPSMAAAAMRGTQLPSRLDARLELSMHVR